ncbi:MAG: hypothetical protein JZU47_20865 [Prolixibacteraceae bacterium]|nr:hypothetical protein [Prolixibacteraceae bacterium]
MKTNKNLKITKKGIEPLKTDGDAIKSAKLHKDKSTKRRLSIYDEFEDENLNDLNVNYRDDQFDEE